MNVQESDVSVYLVELFECELDGFCFFGTFCLLAHEKLH